VDWRSSRVARCRGTGCTAGTRPFLFLLLASARRADEVTRQGCREHQIYFSPEYRRQLDAGEAESTNGLSVWEAHLHSEDRERVTQGLRLYLANPELCYEAVFRFSAQRQQLSLDDAAGRSDP